MRARPLTLISAAVAAALVVAAGCEATVHAKAFSFTDQSVSQPRSQPQQQLVELLLRAITPTAAPMAVPNLSSNGLAGVQARVQLATDQAAAGGATLSVAILDRATHQMVSNGNSQIIATASVAKLFIADDLLLREAQGRSVLSPEDRQSLDVMLQSSDDGAAERFWGQDGNDAIINEVASRYGLTSTTPPSDGRWWNTISSAPDLIRYYEMLLDGSGGLPLDRARLILNDLAQSTPTGVDGYPQRFGIPDGLYAEPVAVKQGWMCCVGADWMHLSTGVIGRDHRYIMVIESLQPSDDATARETITKAVKTIFPNGRI
ncbi:serine hydrolase [Mycobacterium sp. ML4]